MSRICCCARPGERRVTACRCPWYGRYGNQVVQLARWAGQAIDPHDLNAARKVFMRMVAAIDAHAFDSAGECGTRAGYTASMTPALALSALLTLPATQAQPAGVPAIQPQLHVTLQPAPSRPLQRDGDREVICGLVVIHKTLADDPKIVLPPRKAGAAVRRIEPRVCGAK